MLTRKREKLEAQLAEAIWIKNAIEKKTPKVSITDKYKLAQHGLLMHDYVCMCLLSAGLVDE